MDKNVNNFGHFQKKSMEQLDLKPFIKDGYDKEQVSAIHDALEKRIPIQPYLDLVLRGACITEIAIGLEHHINVTPYADTCYTWRKMREIRLGIEQHLDISQYANPLYSYWQMKEIRLGLKDGLDIDYYKNFMYTAKEMKKRRMALKSRKKSSRQTNYGMIYSDMDYDIRISSDGLKAYFNWHCLRPIRNLQELITILKNHGIVYGVNYDTLSFLAKEYKSINENSKKDQNTLIATGSIPLNGKNGFYEWCFNTETERLPRSLNNGTSDFSALHWFEQAKKGQTLAIYHSATAGTDGKTVTGTILPAKRGKEKPMLAGDGFEQLPDLKTYVASKNGQVQLHKKKLFITDLTILDDIFPDNNQLNFKSDVYITGNITGPISLYVRGNLVVDGFVKDAEINCTGNILIKSGVNSSSQKSHISLKGYLICKFFEYTTVTAEGNIYFGTSLNSNLYSCGEIISYGKKGGIIGGSSYSEKGYCLTNLGNPAGTNTTLLLGDNEVIRTQRLALENEIAQIKSTITQLSKIYQSFSKMYSPEQLEKNDIFLKTQESIAIKVEQLSEVNKKMEALRQRQARACHSKIIVEQQLYNNVQIQYMDKKITAIPSVQVEILIKNGKLIIEKLSNHISQTA